jgi:hypothetical protein
MNNIGSYINQNFSYVRTDRVNGLKSNDRTSDNQNNFSKQDSSSPRSFLNLQKNALESRQVESGYTKRLDAKLAVALTAANDSSVENAKKQNFTDAVDLYQDRSRRS